MNTQKLRTLSQACLRNQKLSEQAESIVARVIASIFEETFRVNDLKTRIQEFRKTAEQERINLGDIGDFDLYNFVIRSVAGCKSNLF